jgi:hypothetical protein
MTATTSTLSGPHTARRVPALWAGLALFVGGLLGASATAIVNDSDSSPSQSVATVEGSFRSASAAEAERYVESLENRASVAGVTEHGYAYAHGSSFGPATSSRMSADAAEHRALATESSASMSADAAEHRVQSEQSSLDSCHGATHGVC